MSERRMSTHIEDNLTSSKQSQMADTSKVYPSPMANQSLFRSKKERKVLSTEPESVPLNPDRKVEGKSAFRLKLGQCMYSRAVDNIILLVIIAFSILTFVSLALDCESDTETKNAIEAVELALLMIFLIEIILKMYAVGPQYLRSLWNVFDIAIVIMSLILAAINVSSGTDKVGVLKYSVILRLLRLAVAFRKFNDFKRIKEKIQHKEMNTDFSVDIASERVLKILTNLLYEPWVQATPATLSNLQWCIEVIRSNKLHEAILTVAQGKEANVYEEELLAVVNQFSAPMGAASAAYPRRASLNTANLHINMEVEPECGADVKQCLAAVDTNDFDVFMLKQLTNGHELFTLMHLLFQKRDLIRTLHFDEETFQRFIRRVQVGYNAVPYHNSTHASDVAQTLHFFLTSCHAGDAMAITSLEIAGAYLAASVHDFEHPGVNNQYLVNTQAELAIRYNDKSVLESHHVSASFALTMSPEYDIYSALPSGDYTAIRSQMIDMVLATDIVHHFPTLSQFKNKYPQSSEIAPEDKKLCFQMLIHAADISNPSKPWAICLHWTELVIAEFWAQGDREREQGLPLGYLMDRYTVNIAKSQIGFIDVIVWPTFDALKVQFPALMENCGHLITNKEEWAQRVDAYSKELQASQPARNSKG